MHMVSFSIGGAPSDEPCAQTGITTNWVYLQQLECTVYRAALIADADRRLGALGATPVTTHAPALAAWALPQTRVADPADGLALMRMLWDEAGIQVAANATHGRLLLRLSIQAYCGEEDIAALALALDRLGWPGR